MEDIEQPAGATTIEPETKVARRRLRKRRDRSVSPDSKKNSRTNSGSASDARNAPHGNASRPKPAKEPSQAAFYHNLVPAYEALWPAVARRRIFDSIRQLGIPDGARVLEVGVGTGLSLESYPRSASITGVDLSEPMLAEAQTRIAEQGWDHIRIMPMNAEQLKFPDSSFDFVTSFHTLSVVNEPQKMMSELIRVCRPGGRILVINHFRSKNPLIARVVDSAGKVTERLGWRTDVGLDDLVHGLPIRMDDRYKSNPFSLFTVLKATAKPEECHG